MSGLIQDHIRKQEWMIWARDPWQNYRVTREGYQIQNGDYSFNRVLHGPPGPCEVLAGDKPQIKLTESPSWQYGDLSVGVETNGRVLWFHELDTIVSTHDAGMQHYVLRDSSVPGVEIRMSVAPLSDAPGFIVKLEPSCPVRITWAYGAQKYEEKSVFAQQPMPGGIRPADCAGNTFSVSASVVTAGARDLPKRAYVGTVPASRMSVCSATNLVQAQRSVDGSAASDGSDAGEALPGDDDGAPMAVGVVDVSSDPLYVIACTGSDSDGGWTFAAAAASVTDTWKAALQRCEVIAASCDVQTPEVMLDNAARNIAFSLDGSWLPPAFLHGAVRWGMESRGWYLGWRGLYGPIVLGWYDRVKSSFLFHGKYTLDRRLSAYSGPGKLADYVGFDGATDRWTEGNMGEVYLDQLYAYYCWTGDSDTIKNLYPVIKGVLEWEARTLDPDNDGLFENHINTWISDGHWYCGGAGVQASSYMHRAHLLAAEAALAAGEDPEPYRRRAAEIKDAVNNEMWLSDQGHYAEYRELLGDQRLHDAAELPSIYHPIDSEVTDRFQTYQMLRYVENRLWMDEDLLLANDWYPVIVTNGTIAFSEILHTALCYFCAGLLEKAWRLMGPALRNFAKGRVPGTITEYAGIQGEQGTYADFTDTSSMFARTVVEGVFGVNPRRQDGRICLQPGFPEDWDHATVRLTDLTYVWKRTEQTETMHVEVSGGAAKICVRLRARNDGVTSVLIDGKAADWSVEAGIGFSWIVTETMPTSTTDVEVTYDGSTHEVVYEPVAVVGESFSVEARGCEIQEIYDPQQVVADVDMSPSAVRGRVSGSLGHHTFFIRVFHGNTESWHPIDVEVRKPIDLTSTQLLVRAGGDADGLEGGSEPCVYELIVRNNRPEPQDLSIRAAYAGRTDTARLQIEPGGEKPLSFRVADPSRLTPGVMPVDIECSGSWEGRLSSSTRLWSLLGGTSGTTGTSGRVKGREAFAKRCTCVPLPFNDRLENIFTYVYENPRPPEWALQIKEHALNAWTGTWYSADYINLDHVRELLDDRGYFMSDIGVPFRQTAHGANGLFVSKWDQFPERAEIPVVAGAATGEPGEPRELYLLVAGTTFNNQTYIENGVVSIRYADGDLQLYPLENPSNYDSLVQHFSNNYPQWIGGAENGFYGVGRASGVHADIINIPLRGKAIESLAVECVSYEIIIGILGLTIVS